MERALAILFQLKDDLRELKNESEKQMLFFVLNRSARFSLFLPSEFHEKNLHASKDDKLKRKRLPETRLTRRKMKEGE